MNKVNILKGALSPYDNFCDGFGNPLCKKGNYILGTVLSVGKVRKKLGHKGSKMLDEINAFDMAERNGPYIGQINMSVVSSFCGPQGMIWGYDIIKPPELFKSGADGVTKVSYKKKEIPVYSLIPLRRATKSLFGTVEDRKFPLLPGSHVPCAGKHITLEGPAQVYSCLAIGVPKDRKNSAVLLMEDVGLIPNKIKGGKLKSYKKNVITNISKSILAIGKNQLVEYEHILAGMIYKKAQKGEVACALVACPYFTLARNAIEKMSVKDFSKASLNEWEKSVSS